MAIVQVSRITHRKGLQENLPQLAGAEFGWTVDERRLFIGNSTLEEGAPVIGNTEILTEHSDLLNLTNAYTYKGESGGAFYPVVTGPEAGLDITRSFTAKMDEFAAVTDFGAVGDGATDDTAAINRALYEVFCINADNTKSRRSLYFPAGVYRVTDSIMIPPYAKLFGEGINSSIVKLFNTGIDAVARTADSLQHVVDIGGQGATLPKNIEVFSMSFELDAACANSSTFIVEQASDISFQNVGFIGSHPTQIAGQTPSEDGTVGVTVLSNTAHKSKNIKFNQCIFYGTYYGTVINDEATGVTINASRYDNMYTGILLGDTALAGPTGTIVSGNVFDNIYNIGLSVGPSSYRNISANNIYLDVGNNWYGASSPAVPCIAFATANNVSSADMFERSDNDALVLNHERVHFGNNNNISLENGVVLRLGAMSKIAGDNFTLVNNTVIPAEASQSQMYGAITPIVFDNLFHRAVTIYYTVVRQLNVRVGRINVMQIKNQAGQVAFTDDQYTETGPVEVTFRANNVGDVTYIYYTLADQGVGNDAVLSYSLEYFRDPTVI
jgi:hypothetical protein